MSSCYYYGSVPMKPEMKKVDLVCEDECSFKVPKVYFESSSEAYEEESVFNWDMDSVVLVRDNHVVKYIESTFFEVLLNNAKGETTWFDGRHAHILGVNVEDIKDVRAAKEYMIEEYCFEKSEKRKYRIILEETSKMNEYDHYTLENFLKVENDESVEDKKLEKEEIS